MTALMLEYDCSKHYSEEAKNAFVQRFGQELFERIMQKAEESVRSPNTAAVIQCAREIAQLFSQAISQKVFSEEEQVQFRSTRRRLFIKRSTGFF